MIKYFMSTNPENVIKLQMKIQRRAKLNLHHYSEKFTNLFQCLVLTLVLDSIFLFRNLFKELLLLDP